MRARYVCGKLRFRKREIAAYFSGKFSNLLTLKLTISTPFMQPNDILQSALPPEKVDKFQLDV